MTITDGGDGWTFLLALVSDVPIGPNRSGLDAFAWSGIEMTDVSVATPWPIGDRRFPAAMITIGSTRMSRPSACLSVPASIMIVAYARCVVNIFMQYQRIC